MPGEVSRAVLTFTEGHVRRRVDNFSATGLRLCVMNIDALDAHQDGMRDIGRGVWWTPAVGSIGDDQCAVAEPELRAMIGDADVLDEAEHST